MNKGDRTRRLIIEQSAILFNKQGFAGTAMSQIMDATGLHKGGIYNHFKSKDEIAFAAFDYAVERLNTTINQQLNDVDSPLERLIIYIKSFNLYREDLLVDGGCPIMNTAIDTDDDDTHPAHFALRTKAQEALSHWQQSIGQRLKEAIDAGEAKPETDIDRFTSLAISALEGSIMLSRIHNDFSHLERVIDHLLDIIERDIRD